MIVRQVIRVVSTASIAACCVVAIADAARGWPSGGFYLLYGAIAIVFIGVGWLIAERRPSNVVGPLLVGFGALFAWYLPADLYLHLPGQLPGDEYAALFVSMLDAPMFILVGLVLVLFPDGRLPSPRWRWAVRAGLLGIALALVGAVFDPEPLLPLPDYRSPFGIAGFPGLALIGLAYAVMIVLLVLAAAALATRWRRANLVERAQIKWVVAATLVMVAAELVNIATYRPDEPTSVTTVLTSVAIVLVPVAMGIAILRYRLYEIDRIISRTLSYAVVTAILGVVFVVVVLLLQTALTMITGGQTIAVAASTLAVFALFQPVLRRVRRAIDRRFDRARYDAERTAGEFSERLRDEIDMETVTTDLQATVSRAIAPRILGIWLRTGRENR